MDSIISRSAFFVVAKYTPGGAERRFFYLFEFLSHKGETPHLITNEELCDKMAKGNHWEARVFKMKLAGSVLVSLKYIFRALLYIKKNKIQHVHFCVNPSFYSFFILPAIRLFGCTSSVSIVNSMIRERSDLSPIKRFIWNMSIASADVLDILSPSIRANMFNVFGPDLFRRKPLSISACSFSKDADQIGVMLAGDDSNKRRRRYDFVFASRLIEGKGIELLLSALRLCDEAGYSFTIAICGAGPLAGMVRKSEFHNIKLVFLEYVTNMQDVLLDSKVALSLQRHENYPSQFLLEALAANCNIICTDVGDTRLLLDDDISTLIEYDSVRLKAALITTRYDQSLKRRMAVNRTLDKHSVGAFASYIGSLIVNVQK